jgi:hypothetical protein
VKNDERGMIHSFKFSKKRLKNLIQFFKNEIGNALNVSKIQRGKTPQGERWRDSNDAGGATCAGGRTGDFNAKCRPNDAHTRRTIFHSAHTQCANALSIFISCTVRAYQTKRNKAKAAANEILMNGCRLPSKWLTKSLISTTGFLSFNFINAFFRSSPLTEPPSGAEFLKIN